MTGSLRQCFAIAVFAFSAGLCFAATPGALQMQWTGNRLIVSSAGVHFLSGAALDRLRIGSTVGFDFQISVLDETRAVVPVRRVERYVVSYDLWEERFSAVQAHTAKRVPGLMSASELESWCLENLDLPTTSLIAVKKYVVRVEIRSTAPQTDSGSGFPGIDGLIRVFSRPASMSQQEWKVESPPFRLFDLRAGKSSP